jgi:GTP cyclohydrolase I
VRVDYTPNGRVFGISKLPRIVDYLLHSLPLQEDLPKLVVQYIQQKLNPAAIYCQVEGMHLCMVMRGVKAHSCTLRTSASWFNSDVPEAQCNIL